MEVLLKAPAGVSRVSVEGIECVVDEDGCVFVDVSPEGLTSLKVMGFALAGEAPKLGTPHEPAEEEPEPEAPKEKPKRRRRRG